MSAQVSIGERVQVFVSDPWEFGTACGAGPFDAIVDDVQVDYLVLRLVTPIDYRGSIPWMIAKPRHAQSIPEALAVADEMSANLNLVRGRISRASEIAYDALLDSVAAIGSVHLVREKGS